MKRNALIAFLGLCLSITTACGSSDATTADNDAIGGAGGSNDSTDTGSSAGGSENTGEGSSSANVAQVSFTCPAGAAAILEGMNTGWNSRGQTRDFIANFPSVDADTPVAVVFAWHGVGDTASNFHSFAQGIGDRNAADFPFIMITPQGLKLQPIGSAIAGMEWDILDGLKGDDNVDAGLFEDILGCLAEEYTIDGSRIYTMGFSGGAIMSNMLHSRYPEHIGAVFSMSGAWFNNQDTVGGVATGPISVTIQWDALNPTHEGTVWMTHGGLNDNYGDPMLANFGVPNGQIISFEDSAQHARPWLQEQNRTVIACSHDRGHVNHPSLSMSLVGEFFKAHEAGKPSKWVSTADLPASAASVCEVNP
jgi:poly(3-hydroxybutyrate) depolymerase